MQITRVFLCRMLHNYNSYLRSKSPLLSHCCCNNVRVVGSRSAAIFSMFCSEEKILSQRNNPILTLYREKRSRKTGKQEVESDSDDEEAPEGSESVDEGDDKISKVISTTLSSLRVDLVVKAGLGIARNKVEALFYESSIRVNGEKLLKKSYQTSGNPAHSTRGDPGSKQNFSASGKRGERSSNLCQVGDEVDVVRGPSPDNPAFLVVSRAEVLSATGKGDKLAVKLRRYKSLVIDNYSEPWKSFQQTE
ncbi:mitochondrial transcription rescue factor 1 isoform X1 [Bacillus rossius redtenbacheri]|uniref:mitochondrial transcription rescue factor 1 isoform X1 n=1 Tax=Bacillus rossius redtenbacheri TaxID=93214 RepID=UPI002FDD980B